MILVAGSVNVDFGVPVPHLPAPGETVLGASYALTAGGKGANQALAAARAGGRVAFLGAVGEDDFATLGLASLAAAGVELRHVRRRDAPTGAAFISVAPDGENVITVALGANAWLAPADLPVLEGFTHLLLQLESPLPTVVAYARAARSAGLQVVLNAAPAQPLPPELLAAVDLLVVNEGELAAIAGPGATSDLLREVAARGPATVIVTLGARGSLTLHEGELLALEAPVVQVVDTTAAGDTFTGVLVAWLAAGRSLRAALRAATAGAALACTGRGAQPSMPGRAAIEALLGDLG